MAVLTLLFLSGGGHTGTNLIASLAARRESVRVIATSDVPDEPSLFAFDAVYLAPKVGAHPDAFERRLLEIVAKEEPDLVVPCRDQDVEWLAGLRARRPDLAPRLLCGARDIAAMTNDKWKSHEFAVAHGLPFAPSLPTGAAEAESQVDAFIEDHELPLVVKPRQGADSRGITIVTTRAQALRAMRRDGNVLQRYLGDSTEVEGWLRTLADEGIPLFHTFQGAKRSLQILIGPTGSIEHVVCTTNVMSARNARAITLDSDPVARGIGERCAAVFAAQGWRGPLNVQCQPDRNGALVIHEFNPRFTGATGARWHLGHDEIGAAIRAFTGKSLEPRFPSREAPQTAAEGLWPRAADPQALRTLAQHGEWRRP